MGRMDRLIILALAIVVAGFLKVPIVMNRFTGEV
jgi:hypothetical protein